MAGTMYYRKRRIILHTYYRSLSHMCVPVGLTNRKVNIPFFFFFLRTAQVWSFGFSGLYLLPLSQGEHSRFFFSWEWLKYDHSDSVDSTYSKSLPPSLPLKCYYQVQVITSHSKDCKYSLPGLQSQHFVCTKLYMFGEKSFLQETHCGPIYHNSQRFRYALN